MTHAGKPGANAVDGVEILGIDAFLTPSAWSAADQRSQRSKNCA